MHYYNLNLHIVYICCFNNADIIYSVEIFTQILLNKYDLANQISARISLCINEAFYKLVNHLPKL